MEINFFISTKTLVQTNFLEANIIFYSYRLHNRKNSKLKFKHHTFQTYKQRFQISKIKYLLKLINYVF